MTARPGRWDAGALGNLLAVRYGKALPSALRDDVASFPVVGSAGRMTATSVPLAHSSAVIIGRKGSVGSVHYEPHGSWPIDTTYYMQVPEDCFDGRFLMHQLRALDLRRLDSSTAVPSLRRHDLESQRLVVPPLDEQRRIVDILEDHLSRLGAADDTLRAARVKGDAFMRGTLDGLVWGGTTTPVPVSTLLREPMRNGHSARRARESSDGIRTLTLTAITRRSFVDAHTKITTADPDRVRDLWLEPNDILVQRANTPELVGSSAMFDGPAGWAIFPDLLIRLRPDETRVLPAYLALALQAERTHRALRSKAKGLAGSMPKVDQAAIGSTVIPLPPLKEQRQIVNEAMQTEGASTRLANELAGCMSRSQALRRSLLDAAFSGRLTGHSSDLERAKEMAL